MAWICEFCAADGPLVGKRANLREYFFGEDIIPYLAGVQNIPVEMVRDLDPLGTPKITIACDECAETHGARAVACGNCFGMGREQQFFPFEPIEICGWCNGKKITPYVPNSHKTSV